MKIISTIRLFAFISVSLSFSAIYAQSPGGVKAPELWFKTAPVTKDIQGTYRWLDYSGDSVRLNNYDTRGSLFGSEYTIARGQIRTYNFNPAIDLSEVGVNKQILLGKTNLSQGTIIGVWGSDYADFDQDMVMYTINGRPGDGIIMTKDKIVQSKESGRATFDYGETEGDDLRFSSNDREKTVNKYRERALRVQSYYRINKPSYSNVWGERQKTDITVGDYFYPVNINNSSTFNTSELNNRQFWGFTPEMVIYNRMLTPLERLRVETYLALKYGFALNTSYISSANRLIWDLSANNGYNNRITGTYRDDNSGLYQPLSTTSFEDAPYYSDVQAYESYDGANSNNRPSRYRLLVMGRPYGTNMKDGEYTIWGDDDQTFRVPSTNARMIGGMKTMSRNWKVRTNVELSSNSVNVQADLWNYSNMQMVSGVNNCTFIKETTDNTGSGTATTTQPLSGSNGYISWVYGAAPSGGVTVKFGTQNPVPTSGMHDYGYYINNLGQVYQIISGVRKTTIIATIYINQRIEIEKQPGKITLRVNGNAVLNQDITIASTDSLKTYYGTLQLDKGTGVIKLASFQANGFYYGNTAYNSNGGHRMELSYDAQRATDFYNYRNGQTYLIVDRSGTGTYPSNATDYYLTDELDELRTKIIFNNIQWDKDGNGSDVFTFGYVESGKLAISVDTTNPTCKNGIINKDGIIKIKILSGLEGINYTVVNTADTTIKYTGRLFEDTLHLENIPVGTYNINMSEIGGYNVQSTTTSTFRPSALTTGYLYNGNCAIDFLAGTKDSLATVGFKISSTLITIASTGYNLPDYGVLKAGSNLYLITQGVQSSTPISTNVQLGDKITVERNNGNLLIKLNGTVISTTPIPSADLTKYYFGAVNLPLDNANGEVCNINLTGITPGVWQKSDNAIVKQSSAAKATATATLNQDCPVTPPPPPPIVAAVPDVHLQVLYKDQNLKTFIAKVTLNAPGNSQILVFTISGQLVYQVQLHDNKAVQQVEISLPTPGLYIVKAITPEGEFSKQAMTQ